MVPLVGVPAVGAAEKKGCAVDSKRHPLLAREVDPAVGILEHLVGHRQIAVGGGPRSRLRAAGILVTAPAGAYKCLEDSQAQVK
jgi:hypothetical protein